MTSLSSFKLLQDWAEDRWHWIGVIVELFDANGVKVGNDSVWGIEDNTPYWKEVAAEMVNDLYESHRVPTVEEQVGAGI